jgi:hypothetical protein
MSSSSSSSVDTVVAMNVVISFKTYRFNDTTTHEIRSIFDTVLVMPLSNSDAGAPPMHDRVNA